MVCHDTEIRSDDDDATSSHPLTHQALKLNAAETISKVDSLQRQLQTALADLQTANTDKEDLKRRLVETSNELAQVRTKCETAQGAEHELKLQCANLSQSLDDRQKFSKASLCGDCV